MKIVLQCLKALFYMHSFGIIFRALKPDKILIDNENNIKIKNFKNASIDNENTPKKCFKISEDKIKKLKIRYVFLDLSPYQPPEMKKGEIYDRKIDVCSLGLIFFQKSKTNNNKNKYNTFPKSKKMKRKNLNFIIEIKEGNDFQLLKLNINFLILKTINTVFYLNGMYKIDKEIIINK